MNTQLEPPRVPPLSTAERARLRNQVMDRSRPADHRPVRRWVAPAVSVAAVAAVVAGTLAVTHESPADTGAAGSPLGQARPEAKVGVDLGAVPQTDVAVLVRECQFPDEVGPAQLVWSRHVRGITKDSSAFVAVAVATGRATAKPTTITGARKPGPGGAPSWAGLGYRFCMARTPASAKLGAYAAVGRVADSAWQTAPTAQHSLVALASEDGLMTENQRTLQALRLYRAHPDVAKVESRYVLNGKTGPWTSGVVEGGFAYTEVQAPGKFTLNQRLKTEVRAFDAQGKQIPIG
jgi:hypothetical protein